MVVKIDPLGRVTPLILEPRALNVFNFKHPPILTASVKAFKLLKSRYVNNVFANESPSALDKFKLVTLFKR